MKNSFKLSLFCLGMAVALNGGAASPLGGLAVAVSADGKNLAAAGDNRTLYLLEGENLTVTKRVWLGAPVVALSFNKEGNRLVAEDNSGTVKLLDGASGEVIKQIDKAGQMAVSPEADLLAGVAFEGGAYQIMFYSLSELAARGKIEIAKGERVAALGFDAKGEKLAAWFEPATDATEGKESKVPTELKQLQVDEFKLKNDGKTSWLRVFDTTTGKMLQENKLWYSPSTSGATVLFQGENVLLVTYGNVNANIAPDGTTTLFKTENSFNYGIGYGNGILLSGGLGSGSYVKVADLATTTFRSDKLPGWPEHFKSFAVDGKGVGYGATSGYRIVRIGNGGQEIKAVPVF